jgi:hypothetical protein
MACSEVCRVTDTVAVDLKVSSAEREQATARAAVAALTATHTTAPRQAATREGSLWKVEFDTS